jgi:hypothetical protein
MSEKKELSKEKFIEIEQLIFGNAGRFDNEKDHLDGI